MVVKGYIIERGALILNMPKGIQGFQKGNQLYKLHKRIGSKEMVCLQCGKKFKEFLARIKEGRGKYCSKKCLNLSKRETAKGKNNPFYKNGKTITSHGYIELSGGNGRRYEHRVVMEQHLGRKLTSDEVVHHIDGDKKNNDISNLMIFPDTQEHIRFHRRMEKGF